MFAPHDTIVAIATPEGRGGIGTVRISGPGALAAAIALTGRESFAPRVATFARLRAATAPSEHRGPRVVDQVVVVHFPAPASYTGEDVVELSGHGNPLLLREIVRAALAAGVRLARPGEFTLRAFLNGRLDLVQAEAVADLVNAVTPAQAEMAFDQLEGTLTRAITTVEQAIFDIVTRVEASLDFPEEAYHFVEIQALPGSLERLADDIDTMLRASGRGRVVREGRVVALVGRPNTGKSSVFNALVGSDRAIVTRHAGTTRDLLTEQVDAVGVPVTLVDTAGLREAEHEVEREGVDRARRAAERASAVVLVLDRSAPLEADDRVLLAETLTRPHVVAVNKCDLPASWDVEAIGEGREVVGLSALEGTGIDGLKVAMARVLAGAEPLRDTPMVSNVRHIALLEQARASLRVAAAAAREGQPEEFVLTDLQRSLHALGEVTGPRTPDEVLEAIFGKFCIGK